MIREIIEILHSVPDVIWSGFVASSLTIVGVLFSNRSASNRTKLELAHTSDERERERQMAIRRDVFLPAFEGLASCIAMLTALSGVNTPFEEFSKKYNTSMAPVSKIYAIASEKTIRAVIRLTNEIGKAYLDIVVKRSSFGIRSSQIEALQRFTNQYQNDIDRFLEEMRRYNLDGKIDQPRWNAIKYQFDSSMKLKADTNARLMPLLQEQARETFIFTKYCLEKFTHVSTFEADAIASAREEMGIPIDIDLLKEVFQNSIDDVKRAAISALDVEIAKIDAFKILD